MCSLDADFRDNHPLELTFQAWSGKDKIIISYCLPSVRSDARFLRAVRARRPDQELVNHGVGTCFDGGLVGL